MVVARLATRYVQTGRLVEHRSLGDTSRMPVLVVVLVILLAVGAAYVGWWMREQRRKAFAALAAQIGFQYSPDDPFDLSSMPFALFAKGDGRGTENALWGTDNGREVKLFDFWYYERVQNAKGGSSKRYYRYSCALTEIAARCPHLSVGPEGFLSRLADHVGLRDIEFESEDFNRRFQITSGDRKFAYALVDARMMEWLMATEGLSYEVLDRFVLCFTDRLQPAETTMLLRAIAEFCENVPSVVSDLYPARRSEATS